MHPTRGPRTTTLGLAVGVLLAPTILAAPVIARPALAAPASVGTAVTARAVSAGAVSAAAPAAPRPEFRVPEQEPAGILPGESVIADFTNDADNDVAVVSYADRGLKVFPGKGDGRLGKPIGTRLPRGGAGIDLVTADFNGDGMPDLAVSTITTGASPVVVLLGNGDGTFDRSDVIPDPGTGRVISADFDVDGDPDLAYTHGSIDGDIIEVVFNRGDGTFGRPDVYVPPVFSGIDDITARDVDNDGAPDLVFLSGCPTVRLNQGDGTFGEEICSTDSKGRIGGATLVVEDFDGDGNLDIATGDASGEHVTVSKGDGTGWFRFFVAYDEVNSQVNWLVSADITGDDVLDLLAGSNTGVTALLDGNGNATFDDPVRWITGGTSLTLGQLGGSPLPEVVSGGGLATNEVSVSRNIGRGRFDVPKMYDATGSGGSLQLGDLDGDGLDDVAFVTDDSVIEAHLTRRRATFGPAVVSPIVPNQTGALRLGDVDEDGNLDAVGTVTEAPNLFVALGNGDGSFGPESRLSNGSTGTAGALALVDVNDDGHLDIVSNTSSQISVLLGTGTGTFGAPILSGESEGAAQQGSLIADYNGDGDLDVAAPVRTGSYDFAGMRITVNHGNGDGTFDFAYDRNTNSNLTGADVADLDGDGRPEIATTGTRGYETGRTGLFIWNNVGGTLTTTPDYYVTLASGVLIADMNDDAIPDLLGRGGNNLGVLVNDGTGNFAPARLIPLAADQVSYREGDLTGDGRVDFVALYGSIGRSSFAPYVNTTR